MISPRPAYSLVVDGTPITDRLNPRLLSLTIIDKRGLEADELEMVLDDGEGRLAIPPPQATIEVSIGFTGALVDRGKYLVDETEHSGAPDQLRIRARSADFRDAGARKRTQSYDATTVGAIVAIIAARHGLSPSVEGSLAGEKIDHLDQTAESDWHFLTRLAQRFDAVATAKSGHLLFTPRGQGLTVSGQAMTGVTITRRDGDNHRWRLVKRDAYSGVIAEWHDLMAGLRMRVVAGDESEATLLRSVYATEREAWDAANSEWARIQRGEEEFTFTFAQGRADLSPETPLSTVGFKKEIDAGKWIITECRHRIDDGGFVTGITAEIASA